MDDEQLASLDSDAASIARMGGIHVTRGRELAAVVVYAGAAVGAMWSEFRNGEFTFDLAVLSGHRRKGLGTFLASLALSNHRELDLELGVKLDVTVVSDDCRRILKRLGLVVTCSHAGGISMGLSSVGPMPLSA